MTAGVGITTLVGLRRWRRHAAQLEALADVDPLTGLANRRRLERLDPATVTAAWVIYVDVDRFKCVNDHHGHAAGDLLLRLVANLLQASVRPGDVVIRVGGDEFVVILADCTRVDALSVVTRVQRGVSGGVHGCTLSAGLCDSSGVGRTRGLGGVTGLVQRADAALGEAKRLGGGQVVIAAPELSPVGDSPAGRDRR